MSLKWAISEGVYGMGLQDPCDMVKAILPESQFPAINRYPPFTTPNAVLSEYEWVAQTFKNFHPTGGVKR